MRASPSLLCLALFTAACISACSSDRPAPQPPRDGGGATDAEPGQDLAPGQDALPIGMDALPGPELAPGQDALPGPELAPGQDALPAVVDGGVPVDSGIFDSCNPVTQDCPDPGDKCRIEPAMPGSGAQCTEALPTDLALEAVCMGGDCQGGLVCVRTGTVARCRQACDRTSGAPCSTLGSDFDCRVQVRTTNWGACEQLPPLCNAITQDPCPAAEACQPIRRFDGTFEFRCRPAGPGTQGQRCESAGCARGQVCVREEGVQLCRQPCETAATCPMGLMCGGLVLGVSYCR